MTLSSTTSTPRICVGKAGDGGSRNTEDEDELAWLIGVAVNVFDREKLVRVVVESLPLLAARALRLLIALALVRNAASATAFAAAAFAFASLMAFSLGLWASM
jgi:hypothetical protein